MGAGRSPAARNSVMQVTAQNGKTVYLSSPLVYGRRDKLQIPVGELDKWEQAKKNSSRNEQVAMLADDGSVLYEGGGGKNSAGLPPQFLTKTAVLTHTHPRGKMTKQIGGTLSTQDLFVFNSFKNIQTMRAVAAEGTYSITKGANFNAHEFKLLVKDMNKAYKNMQAKVDTIGVDYLTGKITQHAYYKNTEQVFNAYLVDSHNTLLKGRKKCGYSYSLERS